MQRHIKLSSKQRMAAVCGFSTLAVAGLIGGIYSLGAFADSENEVLIYLPGAAVAEHNYSQVTYWDATYSLGDVTTIDFDSGSPFNYISNGTSYLNPTTENNAYAPGQFINFSSSQDISQYNIYLRERVDEAPKLIPIHCSYTEQAGSWCTDDPNVEPAIAAGDVYELFIDRPAHTGDYIVNIATDSLSNDNLSATFTMGNDSRTVTFPSPFTNDGGHPANFIFSQLSDVESMTFAAPEHACMSDGDNSDIYRVRLRANSGGSKDFSCTDGNYSLVFGDNEHLWDDNYTFEVYIPSNQDNPDNPYNFAIFYDNLNGNSTDTYADFMVGEASVGFTISGTTLDTALARSAVDRNALFAENSDIYFTLDNNFDPNTMQVVLYGTDDYRYVFQPENNVFRFYGANFPEDFTHITIEAKSGDEPGPERPDHPGERQETHITIRSSDAAHRGSFLNSGVFLNERGFHLDECQEGAESCEFDFEYNYDTENDGGKVTFEFGTVFLNKFVNKIIINGEQFDIPVDYSDELSCLTNFSGQEIKFTITVDKAATYDLTYDIEDLDFEGEDVICVSNFLWTSNEEAKGSDEYIGHSHLELIGVSWTPLEGGDPIVIEGEDLSKPLTDEQKAKGMVLEYDPGGEDRAGSLVVPADAVATMKIVPEYGYQVTSFGINEQNVITGETISQFSFPVGRGNFHLGAEITKVADAVESSTNKVTSGSIELGGAEIADGTALLTVSDADIDEDQINNFKNAANGYTVSTYLDINLGQIFYKGDGEYWEGAEMKELIHDATVTLKLAEGVDGNTVVIVHEKHDGTYEVIPTTYDEKTHTISFKTSSFSNYAIASANIANSNTLDNIVRYCVLFVLSSAATIFFATRRVKEVNE